MVLLFFFKKEKVQNMLKSNHHVGRISCNMLAFILTGWPHHFDVFHHRSFGPVGFCCEGRDMDDLHARRRLCGCADAFDRFHAWICHVSPLQTQSKVGEKHTVHYSLAHAVQAEL